jgi:THUMP domain-like
LLDITEGLKQLPHVANVVVVSVNNDCKEVLFHLQKDFAGEPDIACINLKSNDEGFEFQFSDEQSAASAFSEPKNYLYEPNASILKSGAFRIVGKHFQLNKLAVSTHLYTSEQANLHFPGRVFKIVGDLSAQAQLLPDGKANVLSRNHPLSPDDIKKKYKLKDGGERYVLAFSGEKKKYILVTDRVK